MALKKRTFNNFFRAFRDLWGRRSFLQSCGQFSEIHVQKFSWENHDWFMIYNLPKLRFQIEWSKLLKWPSKVKLSTTFFGLLETSEVKSQFYKVVDNSVKYMYKNFRKNIITGSWDISFQSYDFVLNDYIIN